MISKILQLKITLLGGKPPIWRRILVPENYTFWQLHCAIQNAMGWYDCHLHDFRVGKYTDQKYIKIGMPYIEEAFGDFSDGLLSDREIYIKDYLGSVGMNCWYEYDFGDGWEHKIVTEKVLDANPGSEYPVCVGGKRACPPEDCGGLGGFYDLVRAMKHPGTKKYKEMIEWLGGPFDENAFSADDVFFDDPEQVFKEKMR